LQTDRRHCPLAYICSPSFMQFIHNVLRVIA